MVSQDALCSDMSLRKYSAALRRTMFLSLTIVVEFNPSELTTISGVFPSTFKNFRESQLVFVEKSFFLILFPYIFFHFRVRIQYYTDDGEL